MFYSNLRILHLIEWGSFFPFTEVLGICCYKSRNFSYIVQFRGNSYISRGFTWLSLNRLLNTRKPNPTIKRNLGGIPNLTSIKEQLAVLIHNTQQWHFQQAPRLQVSHPATAPVPLPRLAVATHLFTPTLALPDGRAGVVLVLAFIAALPITWMLHHKRTPGD